MNPHTPQGMRYATQVGPVKVIRTTIGAVHVVPITG